MEDNLVIIDYKDLLTQSTQTSDIPSYNPTIHPLLQKAFGNNDTSSSTTLGLIAIRNIPNFLQTKASFLPLAHKLKSLPQSYLESSNLTDQTSMYNAGWSHGKEKLKNDIPDLSKGSFYFNPVTDTPGSLEDRKLYPASYPVNKWPNGEYEIPQFESLAKKLGLIMKDVVTLLAYQIDEYVKRQCKGYVGCMGKEMKDTEKVKGRLLYYFPKDDDDDDDDDDDRMQKQQSTEEEYDSWIGWHNDSGFLTALAGDIYVDNDTGKIIPKEEIDPKAGLYIQDRNGTVTQIRIPDDCMAIQIGECLQIITGGYVVATPHCVKGADPNWSMETKTGSNNATFVSSSPDKKRSIARISFPCFVDTVPSFQLKVPSTRSVNDVLNSSVTGCAKVPPLEKRWVEDGMTFGNFLQKTFALYYELN